MLVSFYGGENDGLVTGHFHPAAGSAVAGPLIRRATPPSGGRALNRFNLNLLIVAFFDVRNVFPSRNTFSLICKNKFNLEQLKEDYGTFQRHSQYNRQQIISCDDCNHRMI